MTDVNVKPTKVIREYSKVETVFGWFCLIAGYLFCRAFPAVYYPLGGFLFIVLLFLVTTVILFIKKAHFTLFSILISITSLAVSSAMLLTSNGFLHFFAFTYSLASYCYFVYMTGDNCIDGEASDFIFADFIKAVFIMPFCSFADGFKVLWPKKNKSIFLLIAKVLLGIVIAVIPTAIVLSQLSYDSEFVAMFEKLFDLNLGTIISNIFSVLFGIPIGAFIFGILISSSDKKCPKILNKETCRDVSAACKFVPGATAVSAVIPVLIVYAVFFVSQLEYYMSAFTGVLPEKFSYAEYAREGFFQLCVVSLINLLIISALGIFMKRSSKASVVTLKIISVIYSVFTLALISTAVSKMILYIGNKGLTQKRVYATWFMAVLALIFLLMIIKQIFPKFKVVFASFFTTVLMFSVLSISNPDALIVKYNVEQCLEGKFETSDILSMQKLGDSAVPYLAEIYEKTGEFEDFLVTKKENIDDDGVFRYTLPKIKARKVLESLDIE